MNNNLIDHNSTKTIIKHPDGPDLSPLQRIFLSWKSFFHPLSILEEQYSQYGDIFRTDTNSEFPVIICCNPKAIQQIITSDTDTFEAINTDLGLEYLMGKHSVMQQTGKYHQRRRKLLMPPFHGDRMRTYGDLIHNITTEVISQWKTDKPFPIHKSLQEISLRVILIAVFGLNRGGRYEQLRQLLPKFLNKYTSSVLGSSVLFFSFLQKDFGSLSPLGKFLRNKQQIDQLIFAEIQTAREQATHRDDILSLLLQGRDEAGQPMADEEIKDDLITMLIAGHETTASALTWALYWIAQVPSVRKELLNELETLPAGCEQNMIVNLPYLSAVCQETLRIYPIIMSAFPRRIVKKPVEIMGYQFEPGAELVISIYLTHQREDIYPEPKQFKPERFLERKFSPYEYLPFGFGERLCLGYAFAMFEMKLVLATILSQCELEVAPRQRIKPVRRGTTIGPPANMQMVVKHKVSCRSH